MTDFALGKERKRENERGRDSEIMEINCLSETGPYDPTHQSLSISPVWNSF